MHIIIFHIVVYQESVDLSLILLALQSGKNIVQSFVKISMKK